MVPGRNRYCGVDDRSSCTRSCAGVVWIGYVRVDCASNFQYHHKIPPEQKPQHLSFPYDSAA